MSKTNTGNHKSTFTVSRKDMENRKPTELKSGRYEFNKYSDKHVDYVVGCLEDFGFINPAVIDDNDFILTGHSRVKAAIKAKMKKIPVIRVSHLSDMEKSRYSISHNLLSRLPKLDHEKLARKTEKIHKAGGDKAIKRMGMTMQDFHALMASQTKTKAMKEGDGNDIASDVQVTKPGDLWLLGNHRLFCGDSRDQESYRILMDGEKARTVLTDPPYNLDISQIKVDRGSHTNFNMGSGEMTSDEFTDFLRLVIENMADNLIDGGLLYIFMDARHTPEIVQAYADMKLKMLNICIWNKEAAGMGSFYRHQHEMVHVLKKGNASHVNNIRMGKFGNSRSDVWSYPRVKKSFGSGELSFHPTVKPMQLIADAIIDCSYKGDIILDPFCGSGTTIIAAENTERRGFGMEISPFYCDQIIHRFERCTGQKVIHADSGKSFQALSRELSMQKDCVPA
jgi:DNA modification methylase